LSPHRLNAEGFKVQLLKRNLLRFIDAVFVSQVAIGFHAQRTAGLMSKPARNGRDVHAVFNAAGGEQVAQVVVGDSLRASQLRGSVNGLLALDNTHDRRFQRFVGPSARRASNRPRKPRLNRLPSSFLLVSVFSSKNAPFPPPRHFSSRQHVLKSPLRMHAAAVGRTDGKRSLKFPSIGFGHTASYPVKPNA
jgi:hypothetical protein